MTVPIVRAFYPTQPRSWLIDFWNLDVKWIFVAVPFGFLTTLLFYYDHVCHPLPSWGMTANKVLKNVSSIML